MTPLRAVALASGLVLAALATGPGPTAAEEPPAGVSDTVDNLITCIAEQRRVAAVLLIDKSGSLQTTDPDASRVDLARSIVRVLDAITGIPIDGIRSRLDIVPVAFGTDTSNVNGGPISSDDWFVVDDQATLEQLLATLESFTQLDTDSDTDYVDALANAQAILAQRASQIDPERPERICQAVFWFSDGRFQLSRSPLRRWWSQDIPLESGTSIAIERGVELICEANGVADQLRQRDTFLFTFGLLSESFFTSDEEALLRSITLGTDDCGRRSADGLGEYNSETNVDEMVACFLLKIVGWDCDEVDEAADCTTEQPCRRAFEVDDSVGSFRLATVAGPSLVGTTLQAPNGDRIELAQPATAAELDGASVSVAPSSTSALLTVALPDEGSVAAGTWVVEHAPSEPGSLSVEIDIFPAYALRLDAPAEAVVDKPVVVSVSLVGRSGSLVGHAGLLESPSLAVEIDGAVDHRSPEVRPGDREGQFVVELTPRNHGELTVTAQGTALPTSGTPLTLSPVSVTFRVLPPGLPTVPDLIRLGLIEAVRATDRDDDGRQPVLPISSAVDSATFTGDDAGASEVCFDKAEIVGAGDGSVLIAADDLCVVVTANSTTQLPLTLDLPAPTSGPISGTAQFSITSRTTGTTQQVSVPIDGSVVVPLPDPFTDAAVAWRLVVLAIGLPLGLYLFLAFLTASFSEPSLVSWRRQRVSLSATGTRPLGNPSDWEFLDAGGRFPRRASAGQVDLRAPIRLFRVPIAEARAAGGEIDAIGSRGRITQRLRRPGQQAAIGRIDHQLHGQWVFVAESAAADGQVEGELTIFAIDRGTADEIGERASTSLAGEWEQLAKPRHRSTAGKNAATVDTDVDTSPRYSSRFDSHRRP